MGRLFYGTSMGPIEIPNRTLAHLQVVVLAKCRRRESHFVSWLSHDDQSPGRTTLWIHPGIPLQFVIDTTEPIALERTVLERMMAAASSHAGLTIDLDSAALLPNATTSPLQST